MIGLPVRIAHRELCALRALEPERVYRFPSEAAKAALVNRMVRNGLVTAQGPGFRLSLPGLLLWLEPGRSYPWPEPGSGYHRGAVALLAIGLVERNGAKAEANDRAIEADSFGLTAKGLLAQGRVRIDGEQWGEPKCEQSRTSAAANLLLGG